MELQCFCFVSLMFHGKFVKFVEFLKTLFLRILSNSVQFHTFLRTNLWLVDRVRLKNSRYSVAVRENASD